MAPVREGFPLGECVNVATVGEVLGALWGTRRWHPGAFAQGAQPMSMEPTGNRAEERSGM